ncbi:MAG: alpha-amylase [Bacteroidaceae bacterium]|nr:alpha-amylase [Bacteroidaceae bacterium]MBQ8542279.1 alpha-amylase [Bacteroidaceae bacterium]
MSRIIVYQLLPRLFGNSNANCVAGGTIEQNGCGKFNDITPKALRAIRNLGITHVWYTGVIEHTTRTDYSQYGIESTHPATVKGEAGSPYAIKDYYDNDPDLAVNVEKRREEFRALIERTHKAGMKVIMDFIPNHVARHYKSDNRPEGTYDFGEFDDKNAFFVGHNNFYYLGEQSYGCNIDATDCATGPYDENPLRATGNDCFGSPSRNDWYDTVKLNYGIDYRSGNRQFSPVPNTWVKMLKILQYWAAQGVDGFRCDMIEMTPVEFWQWAVPKIKEQHKGIIFIGEIYQPHIYRTFIKDGCFDYLYDKVGLYDTLKGVMSGQTSADNITCTLQQTADIRENMLTFLENHDEQRIASDFFAAKAERALAAAIVSVAIGKQPFMLYAGQELGERGMDKEGYSGVDGRTTIFDYWSVDTLRRWKGDGSYNTANLTAEEQALQAFYAKLLNLANSSEALKEGEFYDLQYANRDYEAYDYTHQYSFLRGSKNELLLTVTNFSNTARECKVTIPEEAYAYFGLSSSNKKSEAIELLSGEKMEILLNPAEKISVKIEANSGVIIKIV